MRSELTSVSHVIVVGEPIEGTRSYAALMAQSSNIFKIPPTDRRDPALIHFTSGTTAPPRGCPCARGSYRIHGVAKIMRRVLKARELGCPEQAVT